MKAKLAMLMAVFMALSVFFVAADVCDGDLCVTEVEVDGDDVSDGDLIVLDRGQDIEVDLNLRADSDVDDVQIQVLMTGYEHGVLEDSSKTFSMREDRVYSKDFVLSIPSDLDVDEDNEGVYKLRVIVGDADSSTIVFDFDLVFEADRHEVEVKDILLDPSEVVSGRGVIAAVRVKNNGAKDEDDGVKVTVSIPALGIEASEFIDELDSEESTTSEDLYLRVPKCAEAGTYVVRAEAEFNDGRDSVVEETSVKVVADETCNVANEGDDEEDSRMIITVPKAPLVKPAGANHASADVSV